MFFGEVLGDLSDHTQCFSIRKVYYSFVNYPKGNTGEAVVTCLDGVTSHAAVDLVQTRSACAN